jgi:hypothetical protein
MSSQIACPSPNDCPVEYSSIRSFRIIEANHRIITDYDLALKILLSLPAENEDEAKFIQFCRSNYPGESGIEQISAFENDYNPNRAVQWYTRPNSFPSAIINDICCTGSLKLLSKIQYYLRALQLHLKQLFEESLVWIPSFIVVCRGQMMSAEDFQLITRSKGEVIRTTTFLSATHSNDIATTFSRFNGSATRYSPDEIPVVFKIIIITKTIHSSPLACIQHLSHIQEEKEILLSIGTLFRCLDIEQHVVSSNI